LSIKTDIKVLLDRSSTVLVIAVMLLSIYGYTVLPSFIPLRIDRMGNGHGLRAKWIVFAFPIAAILTYVFIQLLLNYNVKLLKLYEASNSFMQLIRLCILTAIFLTLTLIIIGNFTYGNMFGLWYNIMIGSILSGPVIWYLREVTRI
jgi:hypothetical protein